MRIGPYELNGILILAPMAGVTDRPFRLLCRRFRAALAISEMISSNPELRATHKTLLRSNHSGEPEPRSIQILGACPRNMAEAAKTNVDRGAQIIDINMGCPAKKVCNLSSGSALMRDEKLVEQILDAVVKAVQVPVTLKIRTGWDQDNRNAVNIAKIAESCGIQALTIHGRTRASGFSGDAEYYTIAEVKLAVNIPIIANGDIDTPVKAKSVLAQTGADALMIGRAAFGKPWVFKQIQDYLDFGILNCPPDVQALQSLLLEHMSALFSFYGEFAGVRIARKHILWYLRNLELPSMISIQGVLSADTADRQIFMVKSLFEQILRDNFHEHK